MPKTGQNRQTNPGDWDNSHDKITAMRILGASGEMVFVPWQTDDSYASVPNIFRCRSTFRNGDQLAGAAMMGSGTTWPITDLPSTPGLFQLLPMLLISQMRFSIIQAGLPQ